MDFVFDIIDTDSLHSYCIERLNNQVKTKRDAGYQLVCMMPIQKQANTDRILLIFWKTNAGPCPLKLSSSTPKMLDIEE